MVVRCIVGDCAEIRLVDEKPLGACVEIRGFARNVVDLAQYRWRPRGSCRESPEPVAKHAAGVEVSTRVRSVLADRPGERASPVRPLLIAADLQEFDRRPLLKNGILQ
ncbi:hypothetical protein WJ0W_004888 [Paenibacillus melissococcoides]|uniref:Uncharacterized protein n=1 Tax=Paenibacillus melissococcoides TaxID=2912268 RepID=A0ABN8U9E1_9BACL|nr:hypothetical protein [Paenibacillus melissococcoides]CAH8247635.1 hypothetical protein WJ0W_004888 [Paenibacillus melissococcoides]CAH8705513.1 hypothetical protein HTL2_000971 [Paenibacillus melissococcoides]